MTGSWRARFGAAAAVALVAGSSLVALGTGSVGAATGPVDPSIPDGAAGSLRDVIGNASDGDVILLQAGATYTLADGNPGPCDELRVNDNITIQSTSTTQNATIKQTCPGGRVVKVDDSATIRNVTITGGIRSNSGGGIKTQSTSGFLFLDGVEITGNVTNEEGGGIDVHGALTMIRSTISNNCATQTGGAIVAHTGSSPITIANSTISGNTQGGFAGALDLQADRDLTLTYVTLVDNTSGAGDVCAIAASVDDTAEGTDDADPLAAQGDVGPAAPALPVANLSMFNGTLASFGTVIGLPNGPALTRNCQLIQTPITSNGYNFEQGGTPGDSCGLTGGPGDVQDGVNPVLGALGANGGPTSTRVPQPGSPLLNVIPIAACAGPADDITTDQRGITRPQETGCEIGAVEILAAIELQPTFTG